MTDSQRITILERQVQVLTERLRALLGANYSQPAVDRFDAALEALQLHVEVQAMIASAAPVFVSCTRTSGCVCADGHKFWCIDENGAWLKETTA